MDTGTAGTGTDFHTGAGHFGKFGKTSIPVSDTSVSSVQHQYRYRNFGKFVTTSIRYRTIRQGCHDINTGTSGTGMDVCTEADTGMGTTSKPVPDASGTLR